MAFSWVSPGKTEEAACNEALYLVAEGGIRRVARGQLGRNNESFLFLSVCFYTPPTHPSQFPVRTAAHQVTFRVGSRERQLKAESNTARSDREQKPSSDMHSFP